MVPLHAALVVAGILLLGLIVVVFSRCYAATLGRHQAAADLVTPAFVSKALSNRYGQPVTISAVELPEIARCGDGKASTTDRVVVRATWADESQRQALEAPENMVLKISLLPGSMRMGASLEVIQWSGAMADRLAAFRLDYILFFCLNWYNYYFPHAPDAMYENEARFYRDVRMELDSSNDSNATGAKHKTMSSSPIDVLPPGIVVAPRVYGTVFDKEQSMYGIFMEDLRLRSARFPNALNGLAVDEVRSLLSSLAALHGKFWCSTRFAELDGVESTRASAVASAVAAGRSGTCGSVSTADTNGRDLGWLWTPHRGGMADVFYSIGKGLIRDHVNSHKFEQEAIQPLERSVETLWEGLVRADEMLATEPTTYCHGDCHVSNTYVLPSGTVGLYDWQLSLRASWCRDVSYILGTALATDVRRKHEKELLEFYLERLRAHISICASREKRASSSTVLPPPDFEEAWDLYAKGMAWGLVIGWLICPPVNYGEAIWLGNVNRLVAACKDLDTFGRLGV